MLCCCRLQLCIVYGKIISDMAYNALSVMLDHTQLNLLIRDITFRQLTLSARPCEYYLSL